MTERRALRLNFVKKIAIAAEGVAALALPILLGVMNTSFTSAQSTERARFVTASLRPGVNCEDDGPTVSTGRQSGTPGSENIAEVGGARARSLRARCAPLLCAARPKT